MQDKEYKLKYILSIKKYQQGDKIKQLRNKHPILDFIAGFIPGVGEAQDIHDFIYETKRKNYLGMGLSLAGLIIPGFTSAQIKALTKIGAKALKKLPDGRHLVELSNGKKVIGEIAENTKGVFKNGTGFDADKIAKQAKSEFSDNINNPFLVRRLNEDNKAADAATKIINKEANVNFTTGEGRLLDPDARDVLTSMLSNSSKPKTVGMIGTKPIQGQYRSSRQFGQFMSITDTKNLKYGWRDLDAAEDFIKKAGLSKEEEKAGLDLIKVLRKFEDPKKFKGKETWQGNLKLSKKEAKEYIEASDLFNKYMSAVLEFGTRNHRVIANSPDSRSIVRIMSDNPQFSSQTSSLNLDLIGFNGILPAISPLGKTKKSGFANILDAERTVGGYMKKDMFDNDIFVPGWNQNEDLIRPLLINANPANSNLIFPLHVKGIGPNPVENMTTLQVENIYPSLKKGGNVIRKFKNRIKRTL